MACKSSKHAAIQRAGSAFDEAALISFSYDVDPGVRVAALKQMCPCRVKDDIGSLYDRIFEMASDPDAMVRAQVLHTICDGTPPHLEERVRGALEVFNRDSDPSIRRTAHKVMAVLLRTSKWNVL